MTGANFDQVWSVADAKAHFSELLDQAIHGPQAITHRGEQIAVVMSTEQRSREANRSGSLAEFFAESPLRDSGLEIDIISAREMGQESPGYQHSQQDQQEDPANPA